MNGSKLDLKVLMGTGTALLGLALAFLWRELQVAAELLPTVAAVAAAGVAVLGLPRRKPYLATVGLLAIITVSGVWYASTKEPLLLASLAVSCLGAVLAVIRFGQPSRRLASSVPQGLALGESEEQRRWRLLQWATCAIGGLSASWAFYFHFFTLGIAEDDIARRLILTLGWLGIGAGLVLLAYRKDARVMRDAGFLFIGASVTKVLFYDTSHLTGTLRITALAISGVLLIGCGYLSLRMPMANRVNR